MLRGERPAWVDQLDEWHLLTISKVLIVLVVAIVATWLVRRVVRHALAGMHSLRTSVGPIDARAERRASTVSGVLRSASAAVIWTIASITILSELGVNVGALVAGASIIGAALAFGAQQVVRDVLAGFFMFTEDQYGVGDLVDLGLAKGTVEAVTLRVTRVRDGEGKVWYVPNGQVQRVANLSQQWANVVLDVPVDRSMGVDAAAAAVVAALAPLRDDEVLSPDVLDDPRVAGVEAVLDDRFVLRAVIRVNPTSQDDIAREARALLLDATASGALVAPPLPTFRPVPPRSGDV